MNRTPIIAITSAAVLATACGYTYPGDYVPDGATVDAAASDAALDSSVDSTPSGPPLIAFTSTRTGNRDIFTMHVDGSTATNVTNDPATDSTPLWSPRGDRLAFLSNRTGTQELFVMRPDGTGVTGISRGQAESPVWSPDGTRIAFTSTRSGKAQLYVGNVDGNAPAPISSETTTTSYLEADWSPDGSRFVYTTGDSLVVANADGTGRQVIGTGLYTAPRWSSNGNRVAGLQRLMLYYELFVVNADGSNQANLTNTPMASETDPRWAAAEDLLVVVGGIPGNSEITIVTTGGGRADRTMTQASDSHPRWSGDGSLILFESQGDVFTVPGIGPRTLVNLTNDPAMDGEAVWQPSP